MIEDKWISIDVAAEKLMLDKPDCLISIENGWLSARNDYDVILVKRRIFTGDEHELAQAGKVLDW